MKIGGQSRDPQIMLRAVNEFAARSCLEDIQLANRERNFRNFGTETAAHEGESKASIGRLPCQKLTWNIMEQFLDKTFRDGYLLLSMRVFQECRAKGTHELP